MPHKDMREFLHSFFNPPQLSKAKSNKKKVFKKKKKKTGPTPIQMQLDEAFEYLKYSLKQFEELSSGEERVMHVYREIPDEATTIDRYISTVYGPVHYLSIYYRLHHHGQTVAHPAAQ